jgi:hypothetical protein
MRPTTTPTTTVVEQSSIELWLAAVQRLVAMLDDVRACVRDVRRRAAAALMLRAKEKKFRSTTDTLNTKT